MVVSDRDRGFFARLGRFKTASHSRAADEHLALPLAERLARSWALFESFPNEARPADEKPDPLAIYERARALGLYRR